jgi:hypothetical protein
MSQVPTRNLKELTIEDDDMAIIRVRNCHYVKLVFDTCTIGIRTEDGVVYQFTERHEDVPVANARVVDDPPVVVEAAGGTFPQINEQHEWEIQAMEMGLDRVKKSLDDLFTDEFYERLSIDQKRIVYGAVDTPQTSDDESDDVYEETQLEYTQIM